jgi:hypothetical protein
MFSHSILRRFAMQVVILLCILPALSACSLRPVRVVQKREFTIMCTQLRPEMKRRSLLDEQGAYLSSPLLKFMLKKDYGEKLFQHLSPSFRYSADNPMAAPKTFAENAVSRRDVQIRDYGFTLKQGLDTVDVNLIAQSDWEGAGRKEWLLSCKVAFGDTPVSRTYYLALPDLGVEEVLYARVLAVFECVAYDCELYLPEMGTSAYAPESPVIESMPGQRAVTSPPAKPPVPPVAGTRKPGVPKKRMP